MQQSDWLEASTPLPSATRTKPVTRSWRSTGQQRPSSRTFAISQRQTSSRYAQMDFLSSLLVSPAKTLALQENKPVTMESEVYCSMKSSAWLGSFDLSSSCLKMLEIYSLTKTGRRSKKPSFKLPKQGTMQNGQLFQQVMWEPVTAGSAFGLLPTPRRGETSDLKSAPGGPFQPECMGEAGALDAAYANNSGLEGRESAVVSQYPPQWSTGEGNSPSTMLSPEWTSYVSRPVLCRGDDGLSNRVDRLKQLGNSIVPQVAAIPLRRIKELSQQFSQLS